MANVKRCGCSCEDTSIGLTCDMISGHEGKCKSCRKCRTDNASVNTVGPRDGMYAGDHDAHIPSCNATSHD